MNPTESRASGTPYAIVNINRSVLLSILERLYQRRAAAVIGRGPYWAGNRVPTLCPPPGAGAAGAGPRGLRRLLGGAAGNVG